MTKPTLRQLFFQMFTISACTFGGGFVIVTLMKQRFAEQRGWLTEPEMLDMTALAQSAPGPIAVNTAVLVGWHLAGLPGMLAAVLGCILPPILSLSVISLVYRQFIENPFVSLVLRGMQAGVAAVVMDVVCKLGGGVLRQKSPVHIAVMAGAFIATYFFKVNVIFIILAAALIGVALELMRKRRPDK